MLEIFGREIKVRSLMTSLITLPSLPCLPPAHEADSKEDIFENTCVRADNAAATVKDLLVSID